ncbi:hypothetical protein FS935_07355 [Metabacillus litoralis]|uniref:Uncharacterized protein n=1 Tax=Metabacillus litoralis TaxID=152268 RepID=A0A5C6W499_9BACI|nr:hypothetical protein [Metabacillus litoralis]TXC92190.1 hypothetical protein FS935_07355 [Metabacillus litoralis]
MTYLTMVLGVIALLILGVSLIYTFKVGKLVSERKSTYDTQINEKVQEHPYMRNPIFLAYIIAGILALAYIFYLAFTISW